MKKHYCFALFLLLAVIDLTAQPVLIWNGTVAGPDQVTASKYIGRDAGGNIYSGGNYWNGTSLDYVAVKYNAAGVQQWVQTYNSGANEDLQRTCVDGAGNVYLSGYGNFGGNNNFRTVKFNAAGVQQWVAVYNNPANRDDYVASMEIDGAGNVYVTGYCDQGGGFYDVVTVKYNSGGVQQWASTYRYALNTYNIAQDVTVDAVGNVYVVAYSTIGGSHDIVTIKYNSAGTQQWISTYTNPGLFDYPTEIEVDAAGSAYIVGRTNNGSNYDAIAIKYNTSGTQQWATVYSTAANENVTGMALDAAGNVYYTGYSTGAGPYKVITVKLNVAGVQQWAQLYSAPAGIEDIGNDICLDAFSNILVTGNSTGTSTGSDILLLCYNPSGALLWNTTWTGPGTNTDEGYSALADASGNIYVNGIQHNGTDYDLKVFRFGNTRHYVDHAATGLNNGTSWTNAFTDFQSAVAIADAGDTVYVAAGTYKPSVGPGYNRTKKFTLVDGVKYYGGFPNGGGTFAQRNFTTNRTILSGDIGALNDSTDNCFVVVDAADLTNTTLMSGFTVERGNADSSNTLVIYGQTGGIQLGNSGAMKLDSMTLRNNFGRYAGGVSLLTGSGNLVLTGCIVENNNGRGVYAGGPGTFTGCTFYGNRGINGGAVCVNSSPTNLTFTTCSFTNNISSGGGQGGGAVHVGNGNTTAFMNCTFVSNSAPALEGGAIFKFSGTLSITDCLFDLNTAGSGGAVRSSSGGFNLTRCVFTRNSTSGANSHGGAAYNNGGTCAVQNCVFWSNSTTSGLGGGIYNNTGGTMNFNHCSFANNNAGGFSQGGGLNNNSSSNATVNNCIFWDNLANGSNPASNTEIGHGSGTLTVTNTIWQGNTTGGTILNVNPMFVNQAAGNLALTACSYAIDTGSTVAIATDVVGNNRAFNARPGTFNHDLGAYEFQAVQPFPLVSGSVTTTNVSCFGGTNGTINLTPANGQGPYTYVWTPSGQTTEDRTNLSQGTYSVTVTDVNGCTTTVTASLTQPPSAVSGTTVATNVTCFGASTGAINLTPSGGAGPYTFNWLPSGPTTEDRTGLVAGTYSVQITDANACTATVTVAVTQPASPLSGSTVVTNVACFGDNTGAINLTPAGGTGGYTFNWLPSGPATEDRTGLTAGTYSVQVTDANACTATVTATVTQPTSPLSGSTVVTDVACFGDNTGAIDLTPTGGTGGYTFNWLPSGPATEDRTGLVAGTYSVQITDANGCTGTVTATLTQPVSLVSATAVTTNVSCFGGSNGSATVTASGGTGVYTYAWSPSGGTGATESGLAMGTYSCMITDANGCTFNQTVSVTEPVALTATTMQTNVSCNGGNNGVAMTMPGGGTSPYTYAWSSGGTGQTETGLAMGTYTCIITDANGCTMSSTVSLTEPSAITVTTMQTDVLCNGASTGDAMVMPAGGISPYTYSWSTGGTGATETGLGAGTYTCTVTDANSCTTTATVAITEPDAMGISIGQITNASCFLSADGAIAISTIGGTPGYTWSWSNGDTTESISGLAAMNYCVTITDANGCTYFNCLTVTEPLQLTATSSITNETGCSTNDGAIDLSVSGGTAGYSFVWSNTATTEDVSGLDAGTYSVTVTDANGCTFTDVYTLTEPGPPTVTYNEAVDTVCGGSLPVPPFPLTGESPAGGTWSGPGVTGNMFDASSAGIGMNVITYTYTDSVGCSATATDSIWVDLCLEVTQPVADHGVKVFPNPSSGIFSVQAEFNAVIIIYDATGNVVFNCTSTSGTTLIDLSGFANGLYTINVQQKNVVINTRVILTK